MRSPKLRLNLEWLSDCGGCHAVIVDLHEKLMDVLGEVEIQHCPVLTDVKDYPEADIGLVSGAIRTIHDRHCAEQMRAACRVIVALGTCSVYGGVPGAALAHSPNEILDTVYRKDGAAGIARPAAEVAELEEHVTPLDEAIPVDLYLPGCPPHPRFIFQALRALLDGKQRTIEHQTVCGRCRRRMAKTSEDRIRKLSETIDDPDVCFLSQGIVCLGSVTLDRCLAPCPASGMACIGCAGPGPQILMEPNRDIRTEVADRMSKLTAIGRSEIVGSIEQSAKTHYSFAMASRPVREKPTFLIHKWLSETEAEP